LRQVFEFFQQKKGKNNSILLNHSSCTKHTRLRKIILKKLKATFPIAKGFRR